MDHPNIVNVFISFLATQTASHVALYQPAMPVTLTAIPMEFNNRSLDLYLDGVLHVSAGLLFLDASGAVVFNLTIDGGNRTISMTTDFVVSFVC